MIQISSSLDWTGRKLVPMSKNILGKRIIVCAKKALHKRHVNETISYTKFYSLFDHITSGCEKETRNYFSWECVSVKDKFCDNINKKWEDLRLAVKEASNITATVPFVQFKKCHTRKRMGSLWTD